jgi:FkbM family methyltransferase
MDLPNGGRRAVDGDRATFSEISRFIVRALKARFRDHRAELAIIKQHISSNGIACDIGANKGSFVYWLSRWCPRGRVVAFEPQEQLAHRLANVCATIRLDNVRVEPVAVHSGSGIQDLFIPDGHQPGASLYRGASQNESFSVVSVPVVSLDQYFDEKDQISLLKVDVEGAELGVFHGAERILRQNSPLLVFECENRHLDRVTVRDVFSFLENLGYKGQFVFRNRLHPLAAFSEIVHQRQDGPWFWKQKDYCNNFVFSKTAA